MLGMMMYTGDNEEYMPHPSWGGNGSGPDNWAYSGKLMPQFARTVTMAGLEEQLLSQPRLSSLVSLLVTSEEPRR